MKYSRRQLLVLAGTVSCSSLLRTWGASAAELAQSPLYLLGFGKTKSGAYDHQTPSSLLRWKPGSSPEKLIVPVYAHSVVRDHRNSDRLIAIPKGDTDLAILGSDSKKPVTTVATEKSREFGGHGMFSPDGRLFIASEWDRKSFVGTISVREASTLKIVRSFPSYGGRPHECRFDHDGKTLIVVNAGHIREKPPLEVMPSYNGTSNLAWIDFSSGALLKSIVVNRPAHLGHFALSEDDGILAAGFERSDKKLEDRRALVWNVGAEKSRWLELPNSHENDFKDECASVLPDLTSGLVFAHSKRSKAIYAWDYRSGKFLGACEIGKPSGIVPGVRPTELVTYDEFNKEFVTFNAKSLKAVSRVAGPSADGKPSAHIMRFQG